MKNLLLIIFALFISYNMYSQTVESTKYDLDKLDFSDVKTGHLVDYGLHTIHPYKFNSKLDTVKEVDIRTWLMLYQAIDNGNVDSNKIFLPPTKVIKNKISDVRHDEKINIFMLASTYNYLNPEATFDEYFEKDNNFIIDKKSRKTSPYLKRSLFAISPEINYTKHTDITFDFSDEFFFKNMEDIKDYFYVDFGDESGYKKIKIGDTHYIHYNSFGKKEIKVMVKLDGGDYLYSNTFINIKMDVAVRSLSTPTTKTATKSYNNSSPASGTWQVDYAYGRSEIKKPLIIVEGFDPYNEMNYYNYQNRIDYANLHNDYDIVFVNFNNTTDYIENNAYLLRDIIKDINNKVVTNGGSPNESVVVSFSMGGLISNYALSYMESINESHNVKLNFSWDTPHRGANVPYGMRRLVKFVDEADILFFFDIGDLAGIDPVVNLLKSKAVQEMILYRAYTASSGTSDFYTRYHQMGFPSDCKNLAIANGNLKGGRLNTLDMGDKIFNYHYWLGGVSGAEIFLDAWADGYSNNKVFKGEVWNVWFGTPTNINEEDVAYSSMAVDNSPGGIYDLDEFNLSEENFTEPSSGSYTVNIYKKQFSFVPTLSALDISFSLGSDHDVNNIDACDTPFDNIYVRTNDDNQLHIDSDAQIRNWINYQIDSYNSTDCQNTSYCNLSENYIEESIFSCYENGYGLANTISVGTTYKWSLENYSGIYIAEGEHSDFVGIGLTSDSGSGTLKLTLTTSCGPIVYEKEIRMGAPLNVPSITGPSTIYPNQSNRFYASIPIEASSITWSVPSGFSTEFTGSNYIDLIAPDWYADMSVSLGAKGVNSCGTSSSWKYKTIYVFGIEDECDPYVAMNSNPVTQSSYVSYQMIDPCLDPVSTSLVSDIDNNISNDVEVINDDVEIIIYNEKGIFVNKFVKRKSGKISTEGMSSGIYIVKFLYKNKKITEKLIVK